MEKTFHMLLYRAFHAQRGALRPCLAEVGLGTGQPKLLGYLVAHGPSHQRQLADYFEVDPAAVCRMLDSLEKGGFVARCGDGQDKRRDRIEITPAGRAAYDAWRGCCQAMEDRMLEGFAPEERERFADYLSRAYCNLKRAGEGQL